MVPTFVRLMAQDWASRPGRLGSGVEVRDHFGVRLLRMLKVFGRGVLQKECRGYGIPVMRVDVRRIATLPGCSLKPKSEKCHPEPCTPVVVSMNRDTPKHSDP